MTTLVAPHSPLLIEGPHGSSDSSSKPIDNAPAKSPVSVNLLLPAEIKIGGHGSANSHVPNRLLFGKPYRYKALFQH